MRFKKKAPVMSGMPPLRRVICRNRRDALSLMITALCRIRQSWFPRNSVIIRLTMVSRQYVFVS